MFNLNQSVELIKSLSNANGISGFEDEVLQVIRDYAADDFVIKEDSFRNLYLYQKDHDENKKTVMLDGHSDEIGFMVQSIKENGTLRFVTMGSWHDQNIPAHKVRIKNREGKYVTGVVASKPPHFMSAEERKKLTKVKDMVLDVGAASQEEVIEDYKIEVGAPVIPDVEFEFKHKKNIMMGKAFDNRLGSACVLEVMQYFKDKKLDFNLVGCLSAQEEVGTRGAEITARTIQPDAALVFEGTPADDSFKNTADAQAVLNQGPQIRHRDVSIIANPRFITFANKIAKKNNIPYQNAVRVGGGNDGGKIILSNQGVPTIVLGVPVRYAHTHYGISSLLDYQRTIKWSTSLLSELSSQDIKGF